MASGCAFSVVERKNLMKLSEKIFQRATIKGIADYLLFGSLPEPGGQDYEARLNVADEAYEKTVKQYDNDSASDLLSSANEMANEYACVYMELGLRTGFLLLTDLLKNLQGRPEIPSSNHTMNTADHSTEDDAEKITRQKMMSQNHLSYGSSSAIGWIPQWKKHYEKTGHTKRYVSMLMMR